VSDTAETARELVAVDSPPAPASVRLDGDTPRCVGAWTVAGIQGLSGRLAGLPWPQGSVMLDGGGIDALDTAGALVLIDTVAELRERGCNVGLSGLRPSHQSLLDLVSEHVQTVREAAAAEPNQPWLARVGQGTVARFSEGGNFLAFIGETTVVMLGSLLRPWRIRWTALAVVVQNAGLTALPIVGLLTFLIGVVIAYQGGTLLSTYGANIFIVDLVAIAMVRELAPLLAAIIVAGRTGSAFTAQIGTMNVTEEVDALRTIGINPFEILVLPKVLGLMISLPLLSIFADVMSVFGGMVVAKFLLGVDFGIFLDRVPEVVSGISFVYGLAKTPVFAAIIAGVGCYQGFKVSGGADSVGRQTTQSVVQSIFLVIIANALFAVAIGGRGLYD